MAMKRKSSARRPRSFILARRRACLQGRYGGSLTVECRELDFERLSVRVHVDHGTHVAHLEALSCYGLRQHDAIVFLDHLEQSLLARICGDESWRICPVVDDPDGPDRPLPTLLSLP